MFKLLVQAVIICCIGSFYLLKILLQVTAWILFSGSKGYKYHKWKKGLKVKSHVDYTFHMSRGRMK